VVGDNTMIPGFDKAIRSMQVGERSIVRVSPDLAYGAAGFMALIPPNADITMDLEILDAAPSANIDFDALATAGSTPQTAADIGRCV